MKPTTDQDTVENLIDRLTLRWLLDLVAQVCHEKADHLRANWQDESAGKNWERVSEFMDRVMKDASVKAVS
jgi:hypothetical protein